MLLPDILEIDHGLDDLTQRQGGIFFLRKLLMGLDFGPNISHHLASCKESLFLSHGVISLHSFCSIPLSLNGPNSYWSLEHGR
jgi:hypothetical protein